MRKINAVCTVFLCSIVGLSGCGSDDDSGDNLSSVIDDNSELMTDGGMPDVMDNDAISDAMDNNVASTLRLVSEISDLDQTETLLDTETGLTWVNDIRFCFAGVTNPADSMCSVLSDMNLAGKSDWRLPNSEEMSELTLAVDADESVTLNYINASCAVMTASDGWVFTENSTSPGVISPIEPGNAGVRCVSGESIDSTATASTRLITSISSTDQTETIRDNETELTWVNDIRFCFAGIVDQQTTSCSVLNEMNVAGIQDWRLPNSTEMADLTNAVVEDESVTLNYINPNCAVMTASDGWVFTENSTSPGTITALAPGNAG